MLLAEAQAAGLLEDPVSVQENSLYERIGSDRIRIGAQVYPRRRGKSSAADDGGKEQKLQEEEEAKERGRKRSKKEIPGEKKNEELSKTEKKRESLSVLQGMLKALFVLMREPGKSTWKILTAGNLFLSRRRGYLCQPD